MLHAGQETAPKDHPTYLISTNAESVKSSCFVDEHGHSVLVGVAVNAQSTINLPIGELLCMIADGSRVCNNAEATSINHYWTKSGVRLLCCVKLSKVLVNRKQKNLERHYSYAKWYSEFQVDVFWYFVMA